MDDLSAVATQADEGDYLTIAEAAELLKVHEDTLRQAIHAGRIPVLKLSEKTIRVPLAGLREAWGAGGNDDAGEEAK